MACDDQQFGPVSQRCLQEKDDTLVSSEYIQGKDDLINRKNLERSSDLKRFTRALHAATSRGKGDREAPDRQGTGTEAKIDTFPFPGNSCRSFLYRDTATIGAGADVRVQKRDNITRIDDVEQSLKDLIVRSQPRFGDEERWPRQNKSGISQLSNAWVQNRSDIAEKGYGPDPEESILCAGPHIYEIKGCDHTYKDISQEEEKLGGGKPLVTQAAIDEMLRRGAAFMQI